MIRLFDKDKLDAGIPTVIAQIGFNDDHDGKCDTKANTIHSLLSVVELPAGSYVVAIEAFGGATTQNGSVNGGTYTLSTACTTRGIAFQADGAVILLTFCYRSTNVFRTFCQRSADILPSQQRLSSFC